jgi:hypothetical protein
MATKSTTKGTSRKSRTLMKPTPTQLAEAQATLLALAKAEEPREEVGVEKFMRGLCGHLTLADVIKGVERGMIGAAIDSTEHGTLAEVADMLGQDERYFADRVSKFNYDFWLRMKENAKRPRREIPKGTGKSENLEAEGCVEANAHVKELAALRVQEHELDRFAYYFGALFHRETQPMTVLIALLERLKLVAKSDTLDLEIVIDQIEDRLFSECEAGDIASTNFVTEAGKNTETILNRVLGH